MKALILALLLGSQVFGSVSLKEARIKRDDLQILTGSQWTGTLTYLDYRSKKKVSIHANLNVRPNGEDKWSWIFEYQYPDEPQANSKEIVRLSKDGRNMNDEVVLERTVLPDNTVRFVTEKKDEDNNRRRLSVTPTHSTLKAFRSGKKSGMTTRINSLKGMDSTGRDNVNFTVQASSKIHPPDASRALPRTRLNDH